MASINGLSVKKIVEFRGHEGEPLTQCDVYYNGKNVGFFSMADWGGEDTVKVSKEVEELFKDYKAFSSEYIFTGIGWAIYDVLALHDIEKEYKKAIKKTELAGLVVVKVDEYRSSSLVVNKLLCSMPIEELVEKIKNALPKYKDFDTSAFKLYKSLEDFNITT